MCICVLFIFVFSCAFAIAFVYLYLYLYLSIYLFVFVFVFVYHLKRLKGGMHCVYVGPSVVRRPVNSCEISSKDAFVEVISSVETL